MKTQSREASRAVRVSLAAGTWLWRFFSSVRLAVFLMLAFIGLSLIGTLLIQAPPEVLSDPSAYSVWLEEVAWPKVGAWVGPLAFLHLFDVFHSPWFLGVGALLVTNIVVCSLNRWKGVGKTIARSPIAKGEEFYFTGTNYELSGMAKVTQLAASFSQVLKRHRYRIRTETSL